MGHFLLRKFVIRREDRVKVSENLGATVVAPVAPVDTSLHSTRMEILNFIGMKPVGNFGPQTGYRPWVIPKSSFYQLVTEKTCFLG